MSILKIFVLITYCMLLCNNEVSGKRRDWEQGIVAREPLLMASAGYNLVGYNDIGAGHLLDVGISAGNWGFFYGYSITGSAACLLADGKLTVGPKVSVQANFLVFSGRFEINYLHPYANVNPGAGFTFLGFANVYGGYMVCLNNPDKSGYNLYLNCNIPFNLLSKKKG